MSGVTPPKGAGWSGAPADAEPAGARGRRTSDAEPAGTHGHRSTDTEAADADRLARLLRDGGRGGRGGDGGKQDQQDQKDPPVPLMSPAEAMLAALGGLQPPPAPTETSAPQPAQDAAPVRGVELNELADKVVQRVLVGQRADGETELRVTLKNEMFEGTDVSIARHQGTLELRIETVSNDMMTLMQSNARDFADDLSRRLGMPVVLEVNAPSQSEQSAGHGQGDNRRSRSYDQIVRYVSEING